jgi:enoyl-CoA hydratase
MVESERSDRVELITLDRPERRNALDHPTLLELLEIQERVRDAVPEAVRVVVLTGAPPAFCAGADLTGVEEGQFATDLAQVLRNFTELPVPVIAAIDGPALGAGTQLVIACDLRVATPTSIFGVPAAKLGLVVDHWTIRRLADEFTPAVARAMLVAAETSTAEDLHRVGAIHRLGDLDAALDWATRLAGLAPMTMAAHKYGLEHESADATFATLRTAAWASNDAEEGRAAFLAKRPANFTGT